MYGFMCYNRRSVKSYGYVNHGRVRKIRGIYTIPHMPVYGSILDNLC